MDAVTHPDEATVVDVTEHYVPVRLSTADHSDRARQMEVRWLPGQVVAQSSGRVEHRWVGFLGPDRYRVELLFGRAVHAMSTKAYEEADTLFGRLLAEHPNSARTPEGCYWWGVSAMRQHRNPAPALEKWVHLVEDYPDSDWTEKVAWMVQEAPA